MKAPSTTPPNSLRLDDEAMAVLGGLAGKVVDRRSDNADPDWVSDTRE